MERERQLVFSSDIWDHYRNEEEILEHYVDTLDLSDEEQEEANPYDLEQEAMEWAYDWIAEDFRDQEVYYMNLFNQSFESFSLKKQNNRWNGSSNVHTEKETDIFKWYEDYKSSYRGLEDVAAYIVNGKLIIEFRHHDATDTVEITGIRYNRPHRFTLE